MAQEDAAGGCCGCGCLFLILALLGGCVESCGNSDGDYDDSYSSSSYDSGERGDVHGAWAHCQLFIERDGDKLGIPASEIDFPFAGATKYVEYLGNDEYQIDAYFDAKNRFGGRERVHFSMKLRDLGGKWERLEFSSY